jgi:hypothetical protein
MVRASAAFLLAAILFLPGTSLVAQQNVSAGQARVLRGIPAIAQAFAPIAGVKWQEFAQVLAGICAVESTCSPTYPHRTPSGGWSQYQGLFQMNKAEADKAEANVRQMLPQMRSFAQSGQIPQEAFTFVEQAIQQGMGMSGDKRFHPEYGVILGAAKHIQINKQLADRYPGLPVHQAAGHMTAQFSGIVEGHIRNRNFNAPITPNAAWALGQNRVAGSTVASAIESAGATYGNKMRTMMTRLAQVTNNMSLIPSNVEPFNAPAYQPGDGVYYPNVSHGPISDLLEGGFVQPNDPRVQENFPTVSQGAVPSSPTQPTSPTSPTSPDAGSSGTVVVPPAATLVMQSSSGKPGSTVSLAWSSVGMRAQSCALGIDGQTPFVRGTNAGDQAFKLPGNASSGSVLEIKLTCTSVAGDSVVRGASIAIE